MKETLDTTHEITTKLVKKYKKRDAKTQRITEPLKQDNVQSSPCIRLLCATLWTVRAAGVRVASWTITPPWNIMGMVSGHLFRHGNEGTVRGVRYHIQ